MKINKTQLRKVIRESIKNVLKESDTLSYDQELQPGWYVCIEGNYGDVSVWVTDDLNEVMEVSDSSESNVLGPYNTEMEADEIADQEAQKYAETNGFYRSDNKLTESQLKKIIKESIQNVLEEGGYTSEDINNAFQQWQRRGVSSKYKLPQYDNFNNAIMNANTLLSKANQLWQYLNKEDIKSASLTLQPISDLLERIEGDLMKYNQQAAQQQGQQGMSNQQRQYNQQQNMYGQY